LENKPDLTRLRRIFLFVDLLEIFEQSSRWVYEGRERGRRERVFPYFVSQLHIFRRKEASEA
jgi:hypothetical protein